MSFRRIDKIGGMLSLDIPDRFIIGERLIYRTDAGCYACWTEHGKKPPRPILRVVQILPQQSIEMLIHVHDTLAIAIALGKGRQLSDVQHIDVANLPFTP